MNILKSAAFVLFVIAFPLLLVSTNVRLTVNDERLYEHGFNKYDISEETGIPDDDLMKAAGHLVRYFNGSEASPQVEVSRGGQQIDLFTEREMLHLRDVKTIVQMFYWVQWITLGYVIAYIGAILIMHRRTGLQRIARGLIYACAATLGCLAILGIWALIDFDSLFRVFHYASFRNDLWLLDPSSDYLIMMFPEGFFFDAALLLVGGTVAEILMFAVGSWIYLRGKRKRAEPSVGTNP